MLTANRIAFKEWASIVDCLARGEQILILRKGGIHEKGKKFQVAHEEFFLFPTFEHQNPKDLKPGVQLVDFPSPPPSPPLGGEGRVREIPIRYYCAVQESFWIPDENTLRALDPHHVWSWDCIKSRFDWGEEKGLFGIVIRTYALLETAKLENLKRYGGCRSWVELEAPLATASLKPVLPDSLFEQKKREIDQKLGAKARLD